MAISMKLYTRRRTAVASATRLPRSARYDKPGAHEVQGERGRVSGAMYSGEGTRLPLGAGYVGAPAMVGGRLFDTGALVPITSPAGNLCRRGILQGRPQCRFTNTGASRAIWSAAASSRLLLTLQACAVRTAAAGRRASCRPSPGGAPMVTRCGTWTRATTRWWTMRWATPLPGLTLTTTCARWLPSQLPKRLATPISTNSHRSRITARQPASRTPRNRRPQQQHGQEAHIG